MHPILFKIGTFPIFSYGVFVALAVFVSFAYAQRVAPKFGLDKEKAGDLVFLIFVSGIVGARLFYVAQHAEEYQGRFWQALWVREGGLVWYGGFFLSLVAGIVFAKRNRLPVWVWLDFFAPAMALAHAIGRIGCFLNGCCYGKNEGVSLQLVESGALIALSIILYSRLRRAHKNGNIFAEYLLGYGFLRFFLEYQRGDQVLYWQLTLPQWISLTALSVALWYRLIKK